MISRVPDEGRYDRFETIKLNAWSKGRVAIVGDSAHAMSPGLGQGCGTAISNALSLANMLRESDDIERGARALGGTAAADLRAHAALVHDHLAAHALAPLGGEALFQHADSASLGAEAAAQAVGVPRLRHRGPGALDAAALAHRDRGGGVERARRDQSMTRHAEIAGGGFTGLVMGAALAQAGWTVRVHERTEEIRAFGAGIWIWDNGVRVLKAIGAADGALDGCTEAPTYISWDVKGRYIDEVPFAPITSTDRSRMFCITRQQLLSAILGAAERAGVEIVTGSTATSARPEGVLITEDGREWPADLVIGADGINSKVRDSLGLLKSRTPHVDGAIRVLVPHEPGYADTEEGRTIREWWNGYRRVLYTPCTREVFYLAFIMLARDTEASRLPPAQVALDRGLPAPRNR